MSWCLEEVLARVSGWEITGGKTGLFFFWIQLILSFLFILFSLRMAG